MKQSTKHSRHVARTRPHFFGATLLIPVHKVHNVLTILQLKTWRLGNVQLVLIIAVVEVLLLEDSFHF